MIEYAIPSRARAETLSRKTLPLLLDRLEVPPDRIRLFVHRTEATEYLATIDRELGRSVSSAIHVSVGAHGMAAQRNAVQAFYPADARVITIDDDMRDLVVRRSERILEPIPAEEWADIVRVGFETCDRLGARLWGLYPVPNPYFMKTRIRTDLSYVGGGLYGWINRLTDGALESTLEYRDDWERSVRCYAADGAVVRVEYVSWRTEGYHGAGGMQTAGDRTKDANRRDCDELVRRYPDLVTLNLSKKSGWAEVRLRDRRRPPPERSHP